MEDELTSKSRHSTPAMEDELPSKSRRSTPVVEIESTHEQPRSYDTSAAPPPQNIKNIEKMLIKQGSQIRAMYNLQRYTYDKVSTIQSEVKKLTSNKSSNLSSKVFNVSNLILFEIVILCYRYITLYCC